MAIKLARRTVPHARCHQHQALSELVKAGIFVAVGRMNTRRTHHDATATPPRQALAEQKDLAIETVKLEDGMVVKELLKEKQADLLVLGITDIRSRREELASETDRMMRTAPCPVLIVRDDDDIWFEFEA